MPPPRACAVASYKLADEAQRGVQAIGGGYAQILASVGLRGRVRGIVAQALGIYFLMHDRKLVERRMTVKLITGAVSRMAVDKSIGRAEAMRQSMLELIDKATPDEANPAFWAPFVVVGEGGSRAVAAMSAVVRRTGRIVPISFPSALGRRRGKRVAGR